MGVLNTNGIRGSACNLQTILGEVESDTCITREYQGISVAPGMKCPTLRWETKTDIQGRQHGQCHMLSQRKESWSKRFQKSINQYSSDRTENSVKQKHVPGHKGHLILWWNKPMDKQKDTSLGCRESGGGLINIRGPATGPEGPCIRRGNGLRTQKGCDSTQSRSVVQVEPPYTCESYFL